MSLGNLGATMNQLEGYIASEFNTVHNQGLSILPAVVRSIASRADLTESNLRVTAPQYFDGTNDVDVESGAVKLIAVVAMALSTLTEDGAVVLYETNTVTEGTTRYPFALEVTAGKTTVVAFPEPHAMSALSWSVVDNGSDTDLEGTNLMEANLVKVMFVYAE